jgi:hypothetical protein
MCISNRFADSPMCVIYLAFSFIQKWCVLMMEQTSAKVEVMLLLVNEKAKLFKPLNDHPSDVGYI